MKEYVVLDVETTGFSRQEDRIIEIAIAKVSDGKIFDTYETLVCPAKPLFILRKQSRMQYLF